MSSTSLPRHVSYGRKFKVSAPATRVGRWPHRGHRAAQTPRPLGLFRLSGPTSLPRHVDYGVRSNLFREIQCLSPLGGDTSAHGLSHVGDCIPSVLPRDWSRCLRAGLATPPRTACTTSATAASRTTPRRQPARLRAPRRTACTTSATAPRQALPDRVEVSTRSASTPLRTACATSATSFQPASFYGSPASVWAAR